MSTPRANLGELCSIRIGRTPPRNEARYWGPGHPWLSIADMNQGRDLHSTKETITETAVAECSCRPVLVGTVVFSFKLSVGKVGVVRREMFTNEAIAALPIRDETRLDRDYLSHALSALDFRGVGERAVKGVTLNKDSLSQLKIPIPPLSQQRRIAAILDKANSIRRKRADSVRLLKEFLCSAFLEMFGDPVSNEKHWPVMTIEDLVGDKHLIVDGPFGSTLKPDAYVTSGVRVIRNFNIKDDSFDGSAFKYVTEEKFEEVKRSEVQPGDALLSTKGTLGNVCLMPQHPGRSVLSATGTVRVRVPAQAPMRPQFLVSQMVVPAYKQYLKRFEAGTNQKYLNLTGIRKLVVIVPPVEVQDRFCKLRDHVRSLRDHLVAGVDCVESLLVSLQCQAFQGEAT